MYWSEPGARLIVYKFLFWALLMALPTMFVPTLGHGSALAQAAGAEPGDFIIRRKVPYRPATRQRVPFTPVVVSLTPEAQILGATSGLISALTDEEAALISTGNSLAAPGGILSAPLGSAVTANSFLGPTGNRALAGSITRTLGPRGPLVRSLSGIGTTVTGAIGAATAPRAFGAQ